MEKTGCRSFISQYDYTGSTIDCGSNRTDRTGAAGRSNSGSASSTGSRSSGFGTDGSTDGDPGADRAPSSIGESDTNGDPGTDRDPGSPGDPDTDGDPGTNGNSGADSNTNPGTLTAHLLFPFMNDSNKAEREDAIFMDIVLMGKCQEVWVLNERITRGMSIESEKATEIMIRYAQKADIKSDFHITGQLM